MKIQQIHLGPPATSRIVPFENFLMACTAVQAVVKANSQSNGKGQI